MAQGPGYDEVNEDQEAVDRQIRALERLQIPRYKRHLEDELLERRRDIEPRQQGFRRVALERTRKLRGEGRDTVVVAGEVMALIEDEGRLQDRGYALIEAPRCGMARYAVPGGSVADAVEALRADGVVAGANHAVMLGNTAKGGDSPEATRNDPGTMTVGKGEQTALIVVIDTGLDELGHGRKDLWLRDVGVEEPGDYDPLDEVPPFGQNPAKPMLDLAAGHGTFVAGTIRRVDDAANVVVLRALDTEGIGGEDMVATAICRAAEIFKREEHGGRGVLNLSLGMETIDDLPPMAIERALQELPPDVVVVAAAGNEPSRRPLWPAASKRVIAVAGLCDNLQPSSWSNRGAFVDFSTRAEGIVSTFVTGEETPRPDQPPPDTFPAYQPYSYAAWTGTSFAAPQVSARIARYMADQPDQPAGEAVHRLRRDGTYLPEWGYRVGILDAFDPPLACSGARQPVLHLPTDR